MSKIRLGSTPLWSALAVLASLVAALAALIVAVPNLFSSSDDPVVRFYHAANRACAQLDKAAPLASVIPAPRPLSYRTIVSVGENLHRRASAASGGVTPALFAIAAPSQYADDYRSFERGWEATASRIQKLSADLGFWRLGPNPGHYVTRQTPGSVRRPVPAALTTSGFYRPRVIRLLIASKTASDGVQHLIDATDVMRLTGCHTALKGLQGDLVVLIAVLFRAPGTPFQFKPPFPPKPSFPSKPSVARPT